MNVEEYFNSLIKRSRILREWRKYVSEIEKAAAKLLGEVEVYVFGSAVRGELVGGSDIDILIVSDNVPEGNIERAVLKAEIERLAKLSRNHPFEIHLANRRETKWYYKIKSLKPIKEIIH